MSRSALNFKSIALLLAGLASGACSNSAPPYPPTRSSVPPPPVRAPEEPQSKEAYELPRSCADDTAEWYRKNFSTPRSSSSAEGTIAATSLEYQNHYSVVMKRCYGLLSQMSSFKAAEHSDSRDYIELTHTLWDVERNSPLAEYAVRNVEAMRVCNVAGTTCTSKEQWLELLRPYMAQ